MNELATTVTSAAASWGTEVLLGLLIPVIYSLGRTFVTAFKAFLDGKLDLLEREWNLTIEETARQRIYAAIDTASELVLAAIDTADDVITATPNKTGKSALEAGLAHVKKSMKESIAVLGTTDDVLISLIKKNVVQKISDLADRVRD